MTNKTIIYRFLKKHGISYAEAYPMAEELSKLIDENIKSDNP